MLRVEPADENVDYNDYSIGLPMMNLIKAHPDDPASYPAIKTTADDLSDYDNVVIVAPLWWNNMADRFKHSFSNTVLKWKANTSD